MKSINLILVLLLGSACSLGNTDDKFHYGAVPARSFAKSVHAGQNKDFSVYLALNENSGLNTAEQPSQDTKSLMNIAMPLANYVGQQYAGDPYADPLADPRQVKNPSLWTDDGNTYGMFRDLRAYQPMDVVTVLIRENNFGKKKADTKTDSKFSISAGIAALFGLEKKVESVMPSDFNANSMVDATTNSKLDAKGETKREGSLTGTISAVIMEVLPNGLMRIEGSKIISMNAEEEIMVISGLVRQRDINAENSIDSSRIANMRIDFYGKGTLGEIQEPGWLYGFLKKIMPF
ncbi:MAG: flagellar basal body L-ring protein FlgH [Deltaproteobacteria bacterium]|jgi:flagellar L-ring protein precursor FlgH|nr:flagellar basal body L-ring protein FlgH [Deltaproteobacteria bacterium]